LRQHATAIETATGNVPEEYQSLPFPTLIGHVWYWFIELSRTRGSSGFGPNPITYQELKAWSQLTGVAPTSTEVQAIMTLDLVYMSVQAEEIRKRSQKHG
jgi:hypothetical protein